MASKKRTADDSGPSTRASKAAKTDSPAKAAKGGRKGPKANLATSAFLGRAKPLHLNITHTPPSLAEDESTPVAPVDPGFVGSVALAATSFSTGSYGWKGSKRIVVELPTADSGENAEKVHVMLTVNATVVNSKHAKEDDKEAKESEVVEEANNAEANEEHGNGTASGE